MHSFTATFDWRTKSGTKSGTGTSRVEIPATDGAKARELAKAHFNTFFYGYILQSLSVNLTN